MITENNIINLYLVKVLQGSASTLFWSWLKCNSTQNCRRLTLCWYIPCSSWVKYLPRPSSLTAINSQPVETAFWICWISPQSRWSKMANNFRTFSGDGIFRFAAKLRFNISRICFTQTSAILSWTTKGQYLPNHVVIWGSISFTKILQPSFFDLSGTTPISIRFNKEFRGLPSHLCTFFTSSIVRMANLQVLCAISA